MPILSPRYPGASRIREEKEKKVESPSFISPGREERKGKRGGLLLISL